MSQETPPDIKPIISNDLGAFSPIILQSSPIIIDSDSSSNFSPLEEVCLEEIDEFDLCQIDREISLELGEIGPISSPPVSSNSNLDSTEIIVSSDEKNLKGVAPKLCLPHPIVSQRSCATQTSDTDQSNTFQSRTHKPITPTIKATKFTPYQTHRSKNKKSKKHREPNFSNKINPVEFKRSDMATQSMATHSIPNHLSPLFTHNYTMAAAATLSAAALLQPFLQMPPEIFNFAEKLVAQNPPNFLNFRAREPPVPQFSEGPSSTSENVAHEATQRGTCPFSPATQFEPQKKRPKPTIKWRNSAQFRATETVTEPPQATSPAITTPTNPLPSFSLTHLRNQSIESATPDTTIPTLKTQSYSEPLFKLPSSQNSNSELSMDGSCDERLITYDANPVVAGGRRVIEFTDLAPNTTTETIEYMARAIGPIEDFEFHQGLLFSRATVTYSIPKYALQCRRKYHMYYLDGVHICCNFTETDFGSILKFPES